MIEYTMMTSQFDEAVAGLQTLLTLAGSPQQIANTYMPNDGATQFTVFVSNESQLSSLGGETVPGIASAIVALVRHLDRMLEETGWPETLQARYTADYSRVPTLALLPRPAKPDTAERMLAAAEVMQTELGPVSAEDARAALMAAAVSLSHKRNPTQFEVKARAESCLNWLQQWTRP